jgi:hypothetical protein
MLNATKTPNFATSTPDALGGEDDDEEADPTYNPDVGDLDLNDNRVVQDDEDDTMDVDDDINESSSSDDHHRRTYEPLPPQKRGEWLKELRGMPQEKISSPRITGIISLVRVILRKYADEKIMIVSRFVRFLDIVRLNIANQSVTDTTEFNGFIPADQRIENLRQFSREDRSRSIVVETSCPWSSPDHKPTESSADTSRGYSPDATTLAPRRKKTVAAPQKSAPAPTTTTYPDQTPGYHTLMSTFGADLQRFTSAQKHSLDVVGRDEEPR